jgi:putative hydrolase of the HAD superfamily
MFSRPDLVILDLDNTLYDCEVANSAGENALINFLNQNLKISNSELMTSLIDSRKSVKSTLGLTASSHSRLLYIREFLNSNDLNVHATFALECEQVFWRSYMDKMVLFAGVEEFVNYLRLSRSKLVLVTDLSTQIQIKKLAWLGLEKVFDKIITSEEAGGDKETGKPEAMLRRFVSPVPGNIWAVGDKDWDHLFSDESVFFKKTTSGKLKKISGNTYEFSDFRELLSKINFEN